MEHKICGTVKDEFVIKGWPFHIEYSCYVHESTCTLGVYCLRLVDILNIVHKISNNKLCPNWALL
jgi:hypothetical protein